jgi:hypothetical protein
MSQASGCIEGGLLVSGLLSKLNNCVNNVRLDTVILHLVRILGLVQKFFVSFVVLQDILEAFGNLSKDEAVNLTFLLSTKISIV